MFNQIDNLREKNPQMRKHLKPKNAKIVSHFR